MSMPASPVLSNLDLISNCFTELRVEREQLGEFLSDSLTQLDQWRDQLAQNWHQISEERIELARQRQMLDELFGEYVLNGVVLKRPIIVGVEIKWCFGSDVSIEPTRQSVTPSADV